MENQIILFVLAALAIAAIIIWQIYASAQRRKELAAWAASKGLHFDPSRDYQLDERFPTFSCLRRGSGRYAFNRMSGVWQGHEFLGFDYHYETHSTDAKGHRRTHHHHFSAVVLSSPVPLKTLFLRPEGFLDKITEFLGFDDIDFESTEFSENFYVKAPDKRWAYDVLHQRTMEFLLNSPRFSIHLDGDWGIAYRSSRFSAEEFGAAAEVLRGIFERLPRYLTEELKRRSEKGG